MGHLFPWLCCMRIRLQHSFLARGKWSSQSSPYGTALSLDLEMSVRNNSAAVSELRTLRSLDETRLVSTILYQARHDRTRLYETRLDQTRQETRGQDKITKKRREDKTRRDERRRGKTRQDKTRQGKARQDKTHRNRARGDG